ncbi:FMN-binding protein MioC [Enterovibrio norvegicus]|uniref:FMN-binding protein MioC n=1 Tax=Enterovibrio norvegicus TaxID=188144 RepID=UPI000C817592|nr:FMN-binding protein MioC [Enterovibrio norvegicus]PMN71233.1 FMN-binding protein MioC [Enterovibrio norvegicus]
MTTITLLTGSTLGGAEYVGDHLADLLTNEGHNVTVVNDGELSDIIDSKRLLLITSTHGAGDYPENIAPVMEELEQQAPSLNHLNFAVIAIGDSSYDTFCGAGQHADNLLASLGAKRDVPRLEIDILNDPLPEEPAEVWLSTWKKSFCE